MNAALETIEATLTFKDGETAQILIGIDADSAWGNVPEVLWRTVPIREAITAALYEEGMLTDREEKESAR